MSMSNSEKDELIRNTLANDKFMASGEDVKNKVKSDIDASKIKVKKYTFGERRFIRFLALVLIISLASNAYLIKNRTFNIGTSSNNSEDVVKSVTIEDDLENKIKDEVSNKVDDTVDKVENTTAEEATNIAEENNTVKNVTVAPKEEKQIDIKDTELNEEDLKVELERYSVSVGRFGDDAEQLEKNTILLLIANDFFNDKVSENSGLSVSSKGKYAMTADNVHLYLKELTGIQIEKFLDSYINYMKYNEKSKFYGSGPKSTDLKTEKYDISNLKIVSNKNNEYVVKADLNRKSIAQFKDKAKVWTEEIEANYNLEVIIEFNKEYTYTPYLIKDFKAELKPGEQDNIDRLVDVEKEAENTKKK